MVGRVPQRFSRRFSAFAVTVVAALAVTSCGASTPELTTEEMLEKLEGRPLTPAEVDEKLALADLLCGFENRVLTRMWDDLSPEELEFQDWVFGQHCPDRLTAYSAARPNTGTAPPSSTTTLPGEPEADDGPGDPDGFFNLGPEEVSTDGGGGIGADSDTGPDVGDEDEDDEPITSITGTTVLVDDDG